MDGAIPADLERKLAKYRGQMAQLDSLLSSDSSNTELQKLRGDLHKAITLTESLLKERRAREAEERASAAAVVAAAALVPAEAAASGWSSAATGPHAVPTASLGGMKLTLTSGAAEPLASGAHKGRHPVGTKVEGPIPTADGRTLYYPGVVYANHGGGTATVRYIGVPGGGGWADGVVVEESLLKHLPLNPAAPAVSELRPGFRVLAKYSGDGGWWPAVIDDVTGLDHVRITFGGYGNTEIIPREYLQRIKGAAGLEGEGGAYKAGDAGGAVTDASGRASAASGGGGVGASSLMSGSGGVSGGGRDATSAGDAAQDEEAAQEDKDEKAGLYAGLVIPDNLRLLPTDTEEGRLRKRKKVKVLKLAWKQRKHEEQSAARATSWQSFVSKAGTKRLPTAGVSGGAGGSSGGSIFRSGEGVRARVGVTGSGGGMTGEAHPEKRIRLAGPGDVGGR